MSVLRQSSKWVLYAFWNSDEIRIRALWRMLAQLILLILIAVLLQWLLGTLVSVAPIQGIFQLAVLAGSSLLAARWFDRRTIAEMGLRFNRDWMIDLWFGLALGAILMSSIFTLEYALGWIEVSGVPATQALSGVLPQLLGATILYLCVGVSEELWTRGYLLTNLAEGMRMGAITQRSATVAALVVTSVFFGMMHGDNPSATTTSTINIMLAGLFLGLPYVMTGQMAISIGLHITWNLFQGPIFGFPVSGYTNNTAQILLIDQDGPAWWTGGSFGPEAGGLGLLAMLVGAGAVIVWIAWRYDGVRLCRSIAAPPAHEKEPV